MCKDVHKPVMLIGFCLIVLLLFGTGCSETGNSISPLSSSTIPPAKILNHPPVIDCISCTSNETCPSGTVKIIVAAHDADPGDILSYSYTSTFEEKSISTDATTWKMPDSEGVYPIKVTVSDGFEEVSCSVEITVKQHPNLPVIN